MIARLILRDLSLAGGRLGALLLPTIFFIMVAVLMPFAIGPDARLLSQLAVGLLWVAALLASLLPMNELYAADYNDGTLDQYAARGVPREGLAAARMVALWVSFTGPLLLALPVAATLLGLDPAGWGRLALSLVAGGLGLAALANIGAALTIGARGGVAGLLVLPLAVPMLIFGAGGATPGAFKLLLAQVLLLTAISPFAAAAALGAARH